MAIYFAFWCILVMLRNPFRATWESKAVTMVGDNGEYRDIDQLYWPVSLFLPDDGTIIFTDWANNRIVRYNISNNTTKVLASGNNTGNRLDQLSSPTDVLVDKTTNNLIICDRGNRRVIRQSCRHGITKTEILVNNIACRGLAMDDKGLLYVADYRKHVVKRYQMGHPDGTTVAGGNGKGSGLNQLNKPRYLFIDKHQAVYVSDSGNHRVVKWSKYAKKGVVVAGGQGKGDSLKQLSFPYGLFVNTLGTVYVADSGNDRVMCWPKGARYGIIIVGGNGTGEKANQFNCLRGLAFDRYGNLYIVDYWNHRIQCFSIKLMHAVAE